LKTYQERLTKKRYGVDELVMVEEGFVERNGKMEEEGIWGKSVRFCSLTIVQS
jgi:hypothetical protein